MVTPPSDEALLQLNGWPEGTIGYFQEKELIATLVTLCQQHGYGRIGQLAKAIEELWRDPSVAEHHRKFRQERMEMLKEFKDNA